MNLTSASSDVLDCAPNSGTGERSGRPHGDGILHGFVRCVGGGQGGHSQARGLLRAKGMEKRRSHCVSKRQHEAGLVREET